MGQPTDDDFPLDAGPPDADFARPAPSPDPPEGEEPLSGRVDDIVEEIRAGLAQISAHELELRRREADVGRRYRDLKAAARQSAERELAEFQQRLAQQAAELNAQAVELAARRARLNELAQQLRARQIETEQNRGEATLLAQKARRRVELLRAWRQRQEQVLRERQATIRAHELALKARIHRAHEEISLEREELEQRGQELVARAAQLAQDEQDLLRRRAELDSRLSEGEQLATQVQEHQGTLAAEWASIEQERATAARALTEVEAERTRLAERAAALDQAVGAHEEARARAAHERGELDAAREALKQEQARLAEERAVLAQARTALEAEQEAARAALAAERAQAAANLADERERAAADLTAERERAAAAAAAEQAAAAERLAAETQRGRERLAEEARTTRAQLAQERATALRELEAQRTALTQAQTAAAAEQARLRQEREALAQERTAFAREQVRVSQLDQALRAEMGVLTQKRAELEQRLAANHEQRQELQRQAEDLAARWLLLEQDQAGLVQREERLTWREQQFSSRVAALEAEKQDLVVRAAALDSDQALVDEALAQAQQTRTELHERSEEILEIRARAEAHEREARHAMLALEVERENLEQRLDALAPPLDFSAEPDAPAGAELVRSESAGDAALALRPAQPPGAAVAPRPVVLRHTHADARVRGGLRAWGLRTAAVATVAAAAAVLLWLQSHPPRYTASVPIRIESTARAPADAARWHQARLLDPHLLDEFDNGAWAARWRAARAAGYVSAAPASEEPRLALAVDQPRAADAAALARAAAAACAAAARAAVPDLESTPAFRELASLRSTLVGELENNGRIAATNPAAAAEYASLAERNAAAAEADRLQSELESTTGKLEAARVELAALLSTEAPRGSVAPAEIEAELAQDTVFQEDRQEFRAAALQYRTELTVALLLGVDPAKNMQKALEQFAATLDEQRGLEPPPDVASVLEQLAADAAQHVRTLPGFCERWQATVQTTQSADVREDVAEVVELQASAADAGRKLADGLADLGAQVENRVAALGQEGSGGTRAVVVAAVLRSEHAALAAAIEAFRGAVGKTILTQNPDLEVQDRRVRGLRTRLRQRRESVTERLQQQADQKARLAHGRQIEEGRAAVRGLESTREQTVTRLTATLQKLRDLDDAARRRGDLEAQARQLAQERAGLEARLTSVDEQLAALRAAHPEPDQLTAGEPHVAAADPQRPVKAALAGGGAFGAVCLVSFLLAIRWPAARPGQAPPADPDRSGL